MDCLSANMAAITEFSARISGTLQDQHTQITKLSGEFQAGSLLLSHLLDSLPDGH